MNIPDDQARRQSAGTFLAVSQLCKCFVFPFLSQFSSKKLLRISLFEHHAVSNALNYLHVFSTDVFVAFSRFTGVFALMAILRIFHGGFTDALKIVSFTRKFFFFACKDYVCKSCYVIKCTIFVVN